MSVRGPYRLPIGPLIGPHRAKKRNFIDREELLTKPGGYMVLCWVLYGVDIG